MSLYQCTWMYKMGLSTLGIKFHDSSFLKSIICKVSHACISLWSFSIVVINWGLCIKNGVEEVWAFITLSCLLQKFLSWFWRTRFWYNSIGLNLAFDWHCLKRTLCLQVQSYLHFVQLQNYKSTIKIYSTWYMLIGTPWSSNFREKIFRSVTEFSWCAVLAFCWAARILWQPLLSASQHSSMLWCTLGKSPVARHLLPEIWFGTFRIVLNLEKIKSERMQNIENYLSHEISQFRSPDQHHLIFFSSCKTCSFMYVSLTTSFNLHLGYNP